MRSNIQVTSWLLIALAAVSLAPAFAQTQTTAEKREARPELALTYSYLRSNAPAGGCGCFSLNGGSASLALPIRSSALAIAGEVTSTTASGISADRYDLAITAYSAGVRYSPPLPRARWQPFGQMLVGVAHSEGSLIHAQLGGGIYGASAFAASIGGGLDLRIRRHFSVRPIQAEYLATTFNNNSNNHQNILKMDAGVVFRFGGK